MRNCVWRARVIPCYPSIHICRSASTLCDADGGSGQCINGVCTDTCGGEGRPALSGSCAQECQARCLTPDDECFARPSSNFPVGTVCGADVTGGLGLCDGSNICKVSNIQP